MLTVIGVRHPAGTPEIEIRTPLAGRLLQGGILFAGATVAILVTIALAGRGTFWAILAGTALVVWIAYFCRLLSLAVVVRGDHLKARNLFSTRHIERSVIGAVTLGESSVAKSPNQTVVLALAGGEHLALDACARTLQSPRKRQRVEEFQRRIERWCDQADRGNAAA
jgi:hypothetical protein